MNELDILEMKALSCLYTYISYWYPDISLADIKDSINTPKLILLPELPNGAICMYFDELQTEEARIKSITGDSILVSKIGIQYSEALTLMSIVTEYLKANSTFIIGDNDNSFDVDNKIVGYKSEVFKEGFANYYFDILKGSTDSCKDSMIKYRKITEDKNFETLMVQKNIYEVLMFLASYCSVELMADNVLKRNESISDILKKYLNSDNNPKSKTNYLIKLLFKYDKLEVFKSIIDPITYTLGDIHYDYLLNNINKTDKKKLYKFFK